MWFRPVHEKIVRERLTGSSALYGERLRDIVLGNEVVATFCFGFSFWLHQGGIPHRMCRFYLLLAGAVGKRQGIAIPYPSPTPLLTPGGIRCGGAFWLPRLTGISDSGIRCCRYSPVPNIVWLSVFGSVSFAFQSGCWAWGIRFSLFGEGLFVPAATWGFAMVYRWNYR